MTTIDSPATIPSQSGSHDDWQEFFQRTAQQLDSEWAEHERQLQSPPSIAETSADPTGPAKDWPTAIAEMAVKADREWEEFQRSGKQPQN